MKVLLIDNYDSFTYNLAHDLKEIEQVALTIVKNDTISLDEIGSFDKVVISPGPGLPGQNGNIIEVIRSYYPYKPILGVCLGLQAIYEAFYGHLINLPRVHHGVSSSITVIDEDDVIFKNIPSPFKAGRYHSWVCDPAHIPEQLLVTALDEQGSIMACRHPHFPLHGIQFHPESILTPDGKMMLKNFILKT
jgi:anthranilate synthase component II